MAIEIGPYFKTNPRYSNDPHQKWVKGRKKNIQEDTNATKMELNSTNRPPDNGASILVKETMSGDILPPKIDPTNL